jgi:hypothetical protein
VGRLAGWTGVQALDQELHFIFGNRSVRRNRTARLARLTLEICQEIPMDRSLSASAQLTFPAILTDKSQ